MASNRSFIMVSLSQLICVYSLFFLIKPSYSLQFYDNTDCKSEAQVPGSNYLCSSNKYPCETFIIFRAQENFQELSSISSLFRANQTQLLSLNNLTEPNSHNLSPGREIIIPINCSCSGRFFQANFKYNSSEPVIFSTIACGVFEGLLKAQTLVEQNPGTGDKKSGGFEVTVPVRCACPDIFERRNGVKYLVTYPIVGSDDTNLMSKKFGVPEERIWAANGLDIFPTIFPQTTLLIPMKDIPVLNLEIASPPENSSPSPREVIPLKKIVPGTSSKSKKSYILLGVGVLIAITLLVVAFGLFIRIRRKRHPQSFQPLSAKSSQLSSFSPDFLNDMSKLKLSFVYFSFEELRIATEDFSQESVIGTTVHRGRIGGSYLAVEQMSSEEAAYQVIDILTKINHLNIVKLEGCCDGTTPYLVYEFEANGCLRGCLSNGKVTRELTWTKRMQIAFDLAVGLHYIHYCTNPSYVHRNINSRNVLITADWRAKISGFRLVKPIICSEEERENYNWKESEIVGRKGYLAPEYLSHGLTSLKVDVFAFGVVLLELISAKMTIMEGCMLKDSVGFLADGGLEGSSGCLKKLKEFMDPALEGDYPLGDALCLALLAKGCVEEDPHHRPTMNHVLKALSKIV
ncbi:hypothetical protein HHK36_007478 [Tetracentron sinense]|uniref:Uncharacterized protein n=1 Tax=Tetracentron sinense TaxID=13715 RepID=A0A834ZJ03_TETSI|nr:hypothetical protein HHK36_007478 [Tetracentron sinense]